MASASKSIAPFSLQHNIIDAFQKGTLAIVKSPYTIPASIFKNIEHSFQVDEWKDYSHYSLPKAFQIIENESFSLFNQLKDLDGVHNPSHPHHLFNLRKIARKCNLQPQELEKVHPLLLCYFLQNPIGLECLVKRCKIPLKELSKLRLDRVQVLLQDARLVETAFKRKSLSFEEIKNTPALKMHFFLKNLSILDLTRQTYKIPFEQIQKLALRTLIDFFTNLDTLNLVMTRFAFSFDELWKMDNTQFSLMTKVSLNRPLVGILCKTVSLTPQEFCLLSGQDLFLIISHYASYLSARRWKVSIKQLMEMGNQSLFLFFHFPQHSLNNLPFLPPLKIPVDKINSLNGKQLFSLVSHFKSLKEAIQTYGISFDQLSQMDERQLNAILYYFPGLIVALKKCGIRFDQLLQMDEWQLITLFRDPQGLEATINLCAFLGISLKTLLEMDIVRLSSFLANPPSLKVFFEKIVPSLQALDLPLCLFDLMSGRELYEIFIHPENFQDAVSVCKRLGWTSDQTSQMDHWVAYCLLSDPFSFESAIQELNFVPSDLKAGEKNRLNIFSRFKKAYPNPREPLREL